MRTRSIKKQVWLNSRENELLKKKCIKAGLSESSFFRLVINDTQIKEKPDENFYKILRPHWHKENPFEYDGDKQKNDKINDKEKQILIELMNNPNLTIPEINKITKISTATISRCLKQLQNKKIIERVGSNKSGYWKVL